MSFMGYVESSAFSHFGFKGNPNDTSDVGLRFLSARGLLGSNHPKVKAQTLNDEMANGRLAIFAIIALFLKDGGSGDNTGVIWFKVISPSLAAFGIMGETFHHGPNEPHNQKGEVTPPAPVPAPTPAEPPGELEEFSITSPRLGAAAAVLSFEELPAKLRMQLNFLQRLPALPHSGPEHAPLLPPPLPGVPRQTLVLDLDETLVHCHPGRRGVALRPFVDSFLKKASTSFEIVVFTASQQDYADGVINMLDPDSLYIAHRLYRQHCTKFCGARFKELSLLGRPLERCILVDDSPISHACSPDQGVIIKGWHGDSSDTELIWLLNLLNNALLCRDGPSAYVASRYGLREFFQAIRAGGPDHGLPP